MVMSIWSCFHPLRFCFKVVRASCWEDVWRVSCEHWGGFVEEWQDVLAPDGLLCLGTLRVVPGACYELLVWVVAGSIVILAEFGIIRVLCWLRCALMPVGPKQPWVQLRQQWAAYLLWNLVSCERASKNMLQRHRALADEMLLPLADPKADVCRCTVMVVFDLAIQAGLLPVDRVSVTQLRAIEPPAPCQLLSTWQYGLSSWGLAAARQVTANIHMCVQAAKLVVLLMIVAASLVLSAPYMPEWAQQWWVFIASSNCLLCIMAAAVCWTGLLMSLSAAAALVVTTSRNVRPHQLVVACRSVPGAAPPRTWLQPVSYLALDFSYLLAQHRASSSLAMYSLFGEWPQAAPFHPMPCVAQHASHAGDEWLSWLHDAAMLYLALSLLAYLMVMCAQDMEWACYLIFQPSTGVEALLWVCGVLATSLAVFNNIICTTGVLLSVSGVVLHPKCAHVRWALTHCRWSVTTIASASCGPLLFLCVVGLD
jgi:hypothetical protein